MWFLVTTLAFFLGDDVGGVCNAGVEAYTREAYAEAAPALQQCLTLRMTPPDEAAVAIAIANTFHALRHDREAAQWFARSLELWRRLPGSEEKTALSSLGLADAYRGLGEFAAAEQAARKALELHVSAEMDAALLNVLADMLRERGENKEARLLFRQAAALPGVSAGRKFDSVIGLADLDRREGLLTVSMEGWNEAARIADASGSTMREALALRGLGLSWLDWGDVARAEPLLRRSVDLFKSNTATPPAQMAAALSCLASVYRREGKKGLAEELWLRALEEDRRSVGEEHPQAAVVMEFLAELYSSEKRYDEGRQQAAHANSIMVRYFGEGSLPAAGSLGIIGRVRQYEGDMSGAAADYAAALRILREQHGMQDQTAGEIMGQYAFVLGRLHRGGEAREVRAELKSFRGK